MLEHKFVNVYQSFLIVYLLLVIFNNLFFQESLQQLVTSNHVHIKNTWRYYILNHSVWHVI